MISFPHCQSSCPTWPRTPSLFMPQKPSRSFPREADWRPGLSPYFGTCEITFSHWEKNCGFSDWHAVWQAKLARSSIVSTSICSDSGSARQLPVTLSTAERVFLQQQGPLEGRTRTTQLNRLHGNAALAKERRGLNAML